MNESVGVWAAPLMLRLTTSSVMTDPFVFAVTVRSGLVLSECTTVGRKSFAIIWVT